LQPLMKVPVDAPPPKSLLGDTGYDSDDNRQQLLIHGISPVIKPHPGRKNIPSFDEQAYRNRNQIERMFNGLKQSRRVATRYDKTKSSFQGFITLAAIRKWVKSFVHST
jgi:transposase